MSCYILVLSRWDVQTPGPTEDEEQPQAEEKVQGPQRTEILDSALQMSRLLQTCLSSTEALILPSAILTHDPGPQDVVFVALDFEGFPLPWQIGIATLDARDLLHPQASLDPSQLISTKNYIHLTPSRTAYWSHRKERFGFSFGEEQRACQRDIRRILLSSLQIRDTAGYSDQLRKTVLVGHELSNEVKIMARLGVRPYKLASIVALLDTKMITHGLHRESLLSAIERASHPQRPSDQARLPSGHHAISQRWQ